MAFTLDWNLADKIKALLVLYPCNNCISGAIITRIEQRSISTNKNKIQWRNQVVRIVFYAIGLILIRTVNGISVE